MATADPRAILNVPGRICYGPSDLSTAYPHGGTDLGSVRQVVVRRVDARHEIRDEAFGQEIRDIVWGGENWALAFILRQFDENAVATIFPNTATGTTTQHIGIAAPGTVRPGTLLGTRSVVLLFSPYAPEISPACLFYKAIPLPEETVELNLAIGKRFEIGCVFVGVRDTSNRIAQVKFIKDLSL